jgi:hypothetical protein
MFFRGSVLLASAAVSQACREIDPVSPAPAQDLSLTIATGSGIVDTSLLDSLPDRRPNGAQLIWGVNMQPISQQPYIDPSFPLARQLALVQALGMRHVRIPFGLDANGTPVPQFEGHTLADWLQATAAFGVTTLPVVFNEFTPATIDGKSVEQLRTDAEIQVRGLIQGWGSVFPTIEVSNEFDVELGKDAFRINDCAGNPYPCAHAKAIIDGGLQAAASLGHNAVVGGAKDKLWWLDALKTIPTYAPLSIAAWHFYADGNFTVPSAPYNGKSTTPYLMANAGKSGIWYTEFGRDPSDAFDVTDYNTSQDDEVGRSLGRAMRDAHAELQRHQYGGATIRNGFPVKAAYIYELVDQYRSIGGNNQRVRGLFRCLGQNSSSSTTGCDNIGRKPGADTVRYWIRAFSDSGRADAIRRMVRLAGRWSGATAESDITNRVASLGNGGVAQDASMWNWLVSDDSVRGLFVRSAYKRILGRELDLTDPNNHGAFDYWIGCLRGSAACFGGGVHSREWVYAEMAASDEFWWASGGSANGFINRLVAVALQGRNAGAAVAFRSALVSDFARHGARWRTAQKAFFEPAYRTAEVIGMLQEADSLVIPQDKINLAAAKLRYENLDNSRFQERALRDLMRSRALLRNAIASGLPAWSY